MFFCSSHTKNDACFIQYKNGKIIYICLHNSCKDKKWADVHILIKSKYKINFGKYWSKNKRRETEKLTLQYVTFHKICKEPVERKSIISGFLDEGDQTIISGSGGVGKSMLIFFLAYYLSKFNPDGTPLYLYNNMLFGKFPVPKQRTSLFIQSENNRNQINIRLNKMAGKKFDKREALKKIVSPIINDDVLTTGENFQDKKFQQWIIDLIHKIEDELSFKLNLLFIDPLISFISRDENDSASMRKDLDGVTKIAHTAEITPVVIHHNKKDGSGYRGSSAISDWARNLISLKEEWVSKKTINNQSGDEDKTQDSKVKCIKVEHVKCNNFKKFESFIIRIKKDNNFELVESTMSPEIIMQCDYVCQALKNLGGKANTQKELVEIYGELSGLSPATCKRHIAKAVEEGYICRIKTKNKGRIQFTYSIEENDDSKKGGEK